LVNSNIPGGHDEVLKGFSLMSLLFGVLLWELRNWSKILDQKIGNIFSSLLVILLFKVLSNMSDVISNRYHVLDDIASNHLCKCKWCLEDTSPVCDSIKISLHLLAS